MTRRIIILALTSAALLLPGCEEGSMGEGAKRRFAPTLRPITPCPPPLAAPLDATAQTITLNQYATRSAVEIEAAAAQMNATVQAVIAQATADAARAALEHQRQAATEQAARATQQAQATTDAFNLSLTATAQSVMATATERAYQATATAAQATAQADATAGALAFQATATSQARAMAATATAESYLATQAAYQATATRQAQRREEVLAYGRDYGIPVVLLLALAGLVGGLIWLLAYAVRQHARRPIVVPRNLLGDADPLLAPTPDGGWNVLDIDRQPGHVTRLLGDGRVETPQFRSPAQEERTTARDQVVDGATRPRLGPGTARPATEMPLSPPPTPPAPGLRRIAVLRRLDQAALAGVLPPALVASLEADWEEAEE